MNHIHNFFPVKGAAITGEITIGDWIFDTLNFDVGVTEDTKDLRYSTTAIRLPLQDGQYYLVSGSIFNDGVYQYHKGNTAPLQEETFNGVVVPLAIPKPAAPHAILVFSRERTQCDVKPDGFDQVTDMQGHGVDHESILHQIRFRCEAT